MVAASVGDDTTALITLLGGGPASSGQDIYIFSKGASGAGVYPDPFVAYSGPSGSVGYSSVYGAWTGD